ncbi:MAG: N-acyl homoserine lactonase family protein [Bacteroidales bacterium]|nr:N-acyl homoserine lactonase family protein [Bacteroidales bacterium]
MNHREIITGTSINNVTTSVKLKGKEIKIHAISVGTVAVKKNFKTKKGVGSLSKINILLDRFYTDYLPIWVWVIEHTEGLIVIDTGENTESLDIDKYLANESAFARYQFKHACKVRIQPEDELNHQLIKVGLKVEDVKLVILTHLHSDHVDGLKFFPKQEILVGEYEFTHPDNCFTTALPSWFKPRRVNFLKNRIEIFNQAYPITQTEDLLLIPTPGHTLGHNSILFKTDDFDIIFGGDSSYHQDQVLNGEMAGSNTDYNKTSQTYKNFLDYATLRRTIYLPTHDEDAGNRLASRSFLV